VINAQLPGYVATVPDECDRIIWRGNYYHLPIKANSVTGQDVESSSEITNKVGNDELCG
jgi:hypothetical protein